MTPFDIDTRHLWRGAVALAAANLGIYGLIVLGCLIAWQNRPVTAPTPPSAWD